MVSLSVDGKWRVLNGLRGLLLGQDQLAVPGDAQAVGLPVVPNQDFLAALEQMVCRKGAQRTRPLPGIERKAGSGSGVWQSVGARGIGWHGRKLMQINNKKNE